MDIANLGSLADQLDTFLWPEEDAKQRSKRQSILTAAAELFVRQGYRKTSVDQVANSAGVAKGTVYLYYRNKAELVCSAIALEKRAYLRRLLPLHDAALTPRDRLRLLIALGLTARREMPLTTSLTSGDREIELALGELDRQALIDINELQTNMAMQLLDVATNRTLDEDVLHARARVLVDLLKAVVTSRFVDADDSSWETYAYTLANVVVDGVCGDVHASNIGQMRGAA